MCFSMLLRRSDTRAPTNATVEPSGDTRASDNRTSLCNAHASKGFFSFGWAKITPNVIRKTTKVNTISLTVPQLTSGPTSKPLTIVP